MRKSKRKAAAVNYQLIIEGADKDSTAMYKLLGQVRRKWHPELTGAEIMLAWRKRLKHDQDGHLVLGKCVKIGALQRQMTNCDFVIMLNREAWTDPQFTEEKKQALLDHELCHAAPARDTDGAQKTDEQGRKVWRMRRHDIEEFRCIVQRHGCYKADLELFAKALKEKADAPLLAPAAEGEPARAN